MHPATLAILDDLDVLAWCMIRKRLDELMESWNHNPKPFIWTDVLGVLDEIIIDYETHELQILTGRG
jgi:hypothetical protein